MYASSVYSSTGPYTHDSSFVVYVAGLWEPNVSVRGQFEIWTKPNKSDLRVFDGTQGDNTWRVLIHTYQFNDFKGAYHINAYGVDVLGRRAYVGSTTVYVIPENMTSTVTNFYTSAPKNGKFNVYVTGPSNVANDVLGINIRVWANGLASTEKWYSAQYVKGKWTTSVNIADFANYHGQYTVMAYTKTTPGQSYISTIYVNVP
jgi:hypothetical protein